MGKRGQKRERVSESENPISFFCRYAMVFEKVNGLNNISFDQVIYMLNIGQRRGTEKVIRRRRKMIAKLINVPFTRADSQLHIFISFRNNNIFIF